MPAANRAMAARRRRDFDIAMDVGRIILLVIFAGLFAPPVRQMISGLAVIAVGIVFLAVLVLAVIALIRRSRKLFSAIGGESVALETVVPPSCTPHGMTSIRTTADVLTQLRSIDWF